MSDDPNDPTAVDPSTLALGDKPPGGRTPGFAGRDMALKKVHNEPEMKGRPEPAEPPGLQDREAIAAADWAAEGARRDAAALGAEGDEILRRTITELALAQVAKVSDADRGDGRRVGAERLVEFHRVADARYTEADDERLAGPGPAGEWDGVFAVWAIRSVTGAGAFDGEPVGLGEFDPDASRARPGDLVVRAESPRHGLVKEVAPGRIVVLTGHGAMSAPPEAFAGFYTALPLR